MQTVTMSRGGPGGAAWTRHEPAASKTLCGDAGTPPAGAGGWLDTAASPPMTAK